MGTIQVRECKTADEVFENARIIEARRRARDTDAIRVMLERAQIQLAMLVPRQQDIRHDGSYILPPEEWDAYALAAIATPGRNPNVKQIIAVVSRLRNVPKEDIVSARRTRHVARARQIAMYLAKTLTPLSLPAIGRFFCNRDHTTVLHGIRTIAAMADADPSFASELRSMTQELGA